MGRPSMFTAVRRAIVIGVVAVVAGLMVQPAAFAATSRLGWKTHAGSLHAGKLIVLRLDRPKRAVCTLRITSPRRYSRHWTYAAGAGLIDFAVQSETTTRAGRWTFGATCVPAGTTSVMRATTSLTVKSSHRDSGFIVGTAGPVIEVPVTSGQTRLHNLPPVGGKGGDPGNDYPWQNVPMDSGLDPWGEYYRECTSFVAWALHSRNDFNMPFHDNAIDWGPDAQRLGYAVNSTPALGAVAWETKPPFGHVAWVSAVGNGTVTVEEYNEHGNGTYDQRTVATSAFQYIHFKDLSASAAAPPPPPPANATSFAETTGSVAHTWTDYSDGGGSQGPSIGSNQTVQVTCRVTGYAVADGNNWWYRVASSPWNNGYYVSADAFYNNGQTSGGLYGTPFVDPNVPICGASAPPPSSSYAETTGSVAHTWTDYSDGGGSQGPSIASNQTVQVTCRVTGYAVADGNNWWYQVASSPWNNGYYVSADAFYNDGQTSGSLHGTPFYDPSVPVC